MWALPTLRGDPLKPPQIVWMFRARLYGGETPLGVLYVGFAHVRGRPPKNPQIIWLFRARLYGGGNQFPVADFFSQLMVKAGKNEIAAFNTFLFELEEQDCTKKDREFYWQ